MTNMATGVLQNHSSPEQEGLPQRQAVHVHQYPQAWEYGAETNDAAAEGNAIWQGELPLATYEITTMFDPTMDGTGWNTYGPVPTNGLWDHSITGSPNLNPYGTAWAASPSETLSTNTWSPNDQPLPSPMSEAPSYVLAQSPLASTGPTLGRASPAIPSPATSRPDSPATTTNRSLPTLAPKPKTEPKLPYKAPLPSSKRPLQAASSTPKPRPRTLKRHRSDTPSIASSTHTNSTTSTSTTTLGGILPANVDPRVASEQIRREAWERCRAEAHEMSQRRMRLVDHERGALEREAQRLQENLGRMREAARREGDAAERAGRWAGEGR